MFMEKTTKDHWSSQCTYINNKYKIIVELWWLVIEYSYKVYMYIINNNKNLNVDCFPMKIVDQVQTQRS